MKVFIFLLSSLLVGFSSAAPERLEDGVYAMEGMINSTIQNLLASLPEPIVAEAVELTIPPGALSGTLKMQNMTASGLKALKVPALNFAMIGMRLNITVQLDALSIKADYYDADLVLLDLLPVYGEGPISIDLDGVTISLSTQMNMTGGLQLKNFWIQIALAGAHFDIAGIYYDDSWTTAINDFLNNKLVDFIDNNQGLVTSLLSPIVQDLINGLLAGDTSLAEAFRKESLSLNQALDQEMYYN